MISKLHTLLQLQLTSGKGSSHLLSLQLALRDSTTQDAAGLHCCKSTLLIVANVVFLCQLRNTSSILKVLVLGVFTVCFGLLGEDDVYQYSKKVGYASEEVGG